MQRNSLAIQWLRLALPMQGTRVQSLIRKLKILYAGQEAGGEGWNPFSAILVEFGEGAKANVCFIQNNLEDQPVAFLHA